MLQAIPDRMETMARKETIVYSGFINTPAAAGDRDFLFQILTQDA